MKTLPERVPFLQSHFTVAEFSEHRQRLAEVIGADAVAVVRGAPASGAFEVFRQFNVFYYLCGVDVLTRNAPLELDEVEATTRSG